MHPRRRILHVFSTFGIGGPQVRFANLVEHLGDRLQHSIVAMDGNYDCRARLNPALDIAYPEIAAGKRQTLANVARFRRALRELRPDVMVTCNWGAIEWSIANLVPLVRHIHIEDGFGPEEADGQIRRRVIARRACLRRSTIVVPSRTLWRIAIDRWKLPAGRVHYIPNGIDCARFAAAASGHRGRHWPGEGPVIGAVASLRAEKNLARLLDAFARVVQDRPSRLVVVGDGAERAALEAQARGLGVAGCVHFAGHIADPAPLYPSFDLFALSSNTEQMPLSLVEAMAAGLPVAATRVGDVCDMVSAENRPFIAAADAAALAEAMRPLLSDSDLRARIGAANQDKALRLYDQQRMFEAYEALLTGSVPAPCGVAA